MFTNKPACAYRIFSSIVVHSWNGRCPTAIVAITENDLYPDLLMLDWINQPADQPVEESFKSAMSRKTHRNCEQESWGSSPTSLTLLCVTALLITIHRRITMMITPITLLRRGHPLSYSGFDVQYSQESITQHGALDNTTTTANAV